MKNATTLRNLGDLFAGIGLCAVCAACGVGNTQTTGTEELPSVAPRLSLAPQRIDHTKQAGAAEPGDLLYVSGYDSRDVEVYSWPGGRWLRELRGLDYPLGECVDSAGDVFVTNRLRARVTEFAHGGLKPIGELRHDPKGNMQDCSVDPTTGDLAVANGYETVAIYADAQGKPTIYAVPTLADLYHIGYDSAGNLFVDGTARDSGDSQLAELVKGSMGFEPVVLDGGTFVNPGRIQFAKGTLNIADSQSTSGYAVVYQITVSNFTATVTGTTKLSATPYAAEFWIQGKILTVADEQNNSIEFYRYPAGGVPTKTRYSRGRGAPVGVVISKPQ